VRQAFGNYIYQLTLCTFSKGFNPWHKVLSDSCGCIVVLLFLFVVIVVVMVVVEVIMVLTVVVMLVLYILLYLTDMVGHCRKHLIVHQKDRHCSKQSSSL